MAPSMTPVIVTQSLDTSQLGPHLMRNSKEAEEFINRTIDFSGETRTKSLIPENKNPASRNGNK